MAGIHTTASEHFIIIILSPGDLQLLSCILYFTYTHG